MILLIIILILTVSFIIWYHQLSKLKAYWSSLNFETLPPKHELHSSLYRLKLSFKELDSKIYSLSKSGFLGIISGKRKILYVKEPEAIKNILVRDFSFFTNRRVVRLENSEPYFTSALFNLENEEWKNLRSALTPNFSPKNLKNYFNIFSTSGIKLLKFVKSREENYKNKTYEKICTQDIFERFTIDVIGSAVFGEDSKAFDITDSEFYTKCKNFSNASKFSFLTFPLLLISPSLFDFLGFNLFSKASQNYFLELVRKKRRNLKNLTDENSNNFLNYLLSKKLMNEKSLLGQIFLFFIGGYDTTLSFLTFTLHELSQNLEIQEELYDQLKNVMNEGNGILTYEALNKNKFLDTVVLEALRKYPPVPRIERLCGKDYEIPGTNLVIEKDVDIIIPAHSIHYDSKFYPDPHKFNPNRFQNNDLFNQCTFMPFGVGPRNCIAMKFSILETKTVISHLIINFKILPSTETQLPLKFVKNSLSLRPEQKIFVNMVERSTQS